MGHYDMDNTHRCDTCQDAYHDSNKRTRDVADFGEPEATDSSMKVVLLDGNIPAVKFMWTEVRVCQREGEMYNRYGDNYMSQCQVKKTKNQSRIIPMADLGERMTETLK